MQRFEDKIQLIRRSMKPCPLCGAIEGCGRENREPIPTWVVGCASCGLCFFDCSLDKAVKKWNRRAETTDIKGSLELKPCPFCGGRRISADDYSAMRIFCEQCGATLIDNTDKVMTIEELVEKWNGGHI